MKKAHLFLLVFVLVASLVLVACKPTPNSTSTTATPTPTTVAITVTLDNATPTSPAPTPTEAPLLCDNSYFPSDEDSVWTFSGNSRATGAYDHQDTVTSKRDDGFTITTEFQRVTYAEEWVCTEAGLINLEPSQRKSRPCFQIHPALSL